VAADGTALVLAVVLATAPAEDDASTLAVAIAQTAVVTITRFMEVPFFD
jgi:hypothetical protein